MSIERIARGAIGPSVNWLGGVLDAGPAAFAWVARCIQRSRQRRALAALDARLLRDIGRDSGEAARQAEKPFWRA